jgi:hypothetical protein
MRPRLRKVHDWVTAELRWFRDFNAVWRELPRKPAPAPYVGTLSNDELDRDDWTRTEPEHPPEVW